MNKPSFTYATLRRSIALTLCGLVLLSFGGVVGYRIGRNAGPSSTVPGIIKNAVNPRSGSTADQVNFGIFWQAWNAVDDNFFGDKNPQTRLDGAIAGMVSSMGDPYTVYFTPEQNRSFNATLQGNFGGIGASLLVKDNLVTIAGILPGTPAEKSGLKVGDVIVQVDSYKTAGKPLDEVVDHIRGAKGSDVTLSIARPGADQLISQKVTRDTIVVKSVHTSKIGPNGSITYIKVDQFGDDTTGLMQAALQDAKNAGTKGIVIDLRNNPGGYLQTAVDITGMLVPQTSSSDKAVLQKRVAVLVRDRNGKEEQDVATTQAILPDTKIVVLVNGFSASASEILSGALRDYGRATLLGTKTFGKGSAQSLTQLSNGGSIKVTTEKWFTPLGITIDHQGLTPDKVVTIAPDAVLSDSDAQVQAALDVLAK